MKIGPKEQALREQREDKLNIPDFLKTRETPAQKAARQQRIDNMIKTSKAITMPKPALVTAAPKRDPRVPASATDAEAAALSARWAAEKKEKADKRIKALLEKKKQKDEAQLANANAKRAEMGLPSLVAVEKTNVPPITATLQEKLAVQPQEDDVKTSAKKKTTAKTATKTPTSARKAIKSTAARPSKTGRKSFGWAAAQEAAATKGIVPQAPDFSANTHRYHREPLAECVKLVKAGDVKALQAMKFARADGSPGMIKRYRDIAIVALNFKKK